MKQPATVYQDCFHLFCKHRGKLGAKQRTNLAGMVGMPGKEHKGQKQRRGEPHTSPFPLSDWGIVADAHHLCGAPRSGTLARLPYHISERELHVFLSCLQSKKLSVEEHEGVEKDKGRIDPQLLALPEVFFLHTGEYSICDGQREKQRGSASQTHLSSYTYIHLTVGFLLYINPDI